MTPAIKYENAVSNQGNLYRLQQLYQRANRGEKLTIGFIGGSITMGSVSSTPEKCYAYHVYEWWKETFPASEFVYVNAGIGATDSQFACARAEEDLLAYAPDFVIIEFSVNDAANVHFLETYEGIVRKIYRSKTSPAVLLVHNVCYDNGSSAQLIHSKIARYYQIPSVSMQSTIYTELLLGRIENREITPDDLHPNDIGHAMVADVITHFLKDVCDTKELEQSDINWPETPFTRNAYENSVRYRNGNAEPVCNGFVADTTPQKHITEIFRNGWTASEKGASISFLVKGSCIGVQYRKTMQLPAPVAELILDGDMEHPYILDANFDETWGDKLVLDTILEHGENKEHSVLIRLTETHEEDKLPFYLVSVIGSGEEVIE